MKQGIMNLREFQKLREQMDAEPWIHFRNKLITALVFKRRELGISQKDMAAMLNTTASSITRFESIAIVKDGRPINPPNPTIKTIISYASVLGMEIDFKLVPFEKRD